MQKTPFEFIFIFKKGAIFMKKRPDGRYKVSLTIDGKRHYFYGRTIKLCFVAGSKRGQTHQTSWGQ